MRLIQLTQLLKLMSCCVTFSGLAKTTCSQYQSSVSRPKEDDQIRMHMEVSMLFPFPRGSPAMTRARDGHLASNLLRPPPRPSMRKVAQGKPSLRLLVVPAYTWLWQEKATVSLYCLPAPATAPECKCCCSAQGQSMLAPSTQHFNW